MAGVDRLVVVVDVSLASVLSVEVDMRDMRMGDRGMVMLVAVPGSQMFERARGLAPVVRDECGHLIWPRWRPESA